MRLIQAQNLRRCHYGNSSREAARLTAAPSSDTLTSARATPAGWHLQGCPPHPALSPHVAGTPRAARGWWLPSGRDAWPRYAPQRRQIQLLHPKKSRESQPCSPRWGRAGAHARTRKVPVAQRPGAELDVASPPKKKNTLKSHPKRCCLQKEDLPAFPAPL